MAGDVLLLLLLLRGVMLGDVALLLLCVRGGSCGATDVDARVRTGDVGVSSCLVQLRARDATDDGEEDVSTGVVAVAAAAAVAVTAAAATVVNAVAAYVLMRWEMSVLVASVVAYVQL